MKVELTFVKKRLCLISKFRSTHTAPPCLKLCEITSRVINFLVFHPRKAEFLPLLLSAQRYKFFLSFACFAIPTVAVAFEGAIAFYECRSSTDSTRQPTVSEWHHNTHISFNYIGIPALFITRKPKAFYQASNGEVWREKFRMKK